MPETLTEPLPIDRRRAIRRALLRWYRRAHRPLPWRAPPGERPDPWAVLVSETMLQQTQVATVIDYFRTFMARWPTPRDLARSEVAEVLTAWQGLGYYRRGRHLHAAARRIAAEHGGAVPEDPEALRRLPGVGRYTAGAVASIAFGRPEPAVDGNVKRVLARLERITRPVDEPGAERLIWQRAGELVAPRRPGDFNQALMELGARICTPRAPDCPACPLRRACRGRAAGDPARWPVAGRRTVQKRVAHEILALHRRGRWLFEQRDEEGLWAAMWQLPTRQFHDTPEGASPPQPAGTWIAGRFGLAIATPEYVGAFEHQTTHRRIRFTLRTARVTGGRLRRGRGRWRRLDDLSDLPLGGPQHRAIRMLGAPAPAS